jgi:hypothetical protein
MVDSSMPMKQIGSDDSVSLASIAETLAKILEGNSTVHPPKPSAHINFSH